VKSRTCWERVDDWVWIDGRQKEVMQQALLLPPESEIAELIQNRFHLQSILEKLPNLEVFARICLLVVMLVLLLRDLDVTTDYTIWLTLPYMVLILHIFNLLIGIYMGFKIKPTEVLFKYNKTWLINNSADLEQFEENGESESLFDLSQPSDYLLEGESLPKYYAFDLWKIKVISSEMALLFVSVDLIFYFVYMVLSKFFSGLEKLDRHGLIVYITPFITVWAEWVLSCEPWIPRHLKRIIIPCMILFHIIPIIYLENFVYHDNLYGCDFSIWPETFLEGKV